MNLDSEIYEQFKDKERLFKKYSIENRLNDVFCVKIIDSRY